MNNSNRLALPSPQQEAEIAPLAYDLVCAYRSMVEHFQKGYKLTPGEADVKTQELIKPGQPAYEERLRNGPPEEASWWEIQKLLENDPAAGQQRWDNIKQAARDELQSGYRAARTVEGFHHRPWERAQFLALRATLMQDWQPRNGIEQTLIDTMAQAQTYYLHWLKMLTNFTSLESERQQAKIEQRGEWQPARVSDHEAIDQAAAMVDRFNKLFLRTLRQLRDLRRYTPAVTIQSAGQVNIGGQQVNMLNPITEEN